MAAAVVVVVVTEAVAAIDAIGPAKDREFDLTQRPFLDSIQSALAGSLELLEKKVFPFASRRGLKYLMAQHQRRVFPVS
jgi:hypothetical protein